MLAQEGVFITLPSSQCGSLRPLLSGWKNVFLSSHLEHLTEDDLWSVYYFNIPTYNIIFFWIPCFILGYLP